MTLSARRLQTRRPRKDRDVTWSRRYLPTASTITWTFWRRDRNGALHSLSWDPSLTEIEESPPGAMKGALRFIHRKLRNEVDEIDLQAMEETA